MLETLTHFKVAGKFENVIKVMYSGFVCEPIEHVLFFSLSVRQGFSAVQPGEPALKLSICVKKKSVDYFVPS